MIAAFLLLCLNAFVWAYVAHTMTKKKQNGAALIVLLFIAHAIAIMAMYDVVFPTLEGMP